MDKNNTTKRTQPQPGTPATDVVEGGLSTAMAAERPIALVTKEPVPTVDKIDEIDEIDETNETNETNESSLKRVRKEGEPSSDESSDGPSASKRVRKEGEPSDGHSASSTKRATEKA